MGNDKSANWRDWGRCSGNTPVRGADSLDFSGDGRGGKNWLNPQLF